MHLFNRINSIYYSGVMGIPKPGFWVPVVTTMEKWVEGKMNKTFLHFCQIFVIFDDFSKWSVLKGHSGTLKNHQIWQKFGKILPSAHFSANSVGTQKADFG